MSPARTAANTSAGSSSSGGIEARRRDRGPWLGPQLRPVELGDPVQGGEVEHAGDLVAVLGFEAEPALQQGARGGRHRPLHLEPDRLAEAASPELLLDRHQEVVGLVLLDREVGVAGDAEQVRLDDLHAREQVLEIGLDDLVDRHEVVGLDFEQARQDLRDLDPREHALAGLRIAQADRDRQAERRDVRERVARIDRERGQDGVDLVEEALAERGVMLGDVRVVDDLDAFGGKRPPDLDEDRRMVGDERQDPLANGRDLFPRRPPVGGPSDGARLDLLAQARDADLEELVEIAGEDGQELDPLEQRITGVASLVEHARVELEPREFAVEIRKLGLFLARSPGASWSQG